MTEDRKRLNGKVAIVTGASSGIGAAIAHLFAEHGALVIAVDIAEPPAGHRASGMEWARLDIASEDGWESLIRGVEARHAGLDILVNGAGYGGSGAMIEDETLEDWNRSIAVNQTGCFLGMRAAIPLMRARGGGAIVNISSIWGICAIAPLASYHAAKAAVRAMTINGAVAYAGDGIRINSVHPGITATPPVLAVPDAAAAVVAATPMRRMAQPREIAMGCLFLASDEASFVTGAELVMDGGYVAA